MRLSILLLLFSSGAVLVATHGVRESGGLESPPSSSTSQCPSCRWTRARKRAYDLAALKEKILHKLRLDRPPDVVAPSRTDVQQVPSIESLINECEGGGNASREADSTGHGVSDGSADPDASVVVFHLAEPSGPDVRVVRFSLQETRQDLENLQSATFGVFLRRGNSGSRPGGRTTINITLSRILGYGTSGSPETERLHSRRVPANQHERWYTAWGPANVTAVVSEWIRDPTTNLGFYVEPFQQSRQPNDILVLNSSTTEIYRPYLELRFREPDPSSTPLRPASARPRRTVSPQDCDERTTHSYCCRFPLEVDFSSFGWDSWIIAPRRTIAYYCSGDCPYAYRPTHTSIVNQMVRNEVVPCCYPTRTSDMKVLYQADNGTFLHSAIPGLIVDTCGCS